MHGFRATWLTHVLSLAIQNQIFYQLVEGYLKGLFWVRWGSVFSVYINDIIPTLNGCQFYIVYRILLRQPSTTCKVLLILSRNPWSNINSWLMQIRQNTFCSHKPNILITTTNNKTGSEIERVTVYKHLGVWIDENFSFHINELILNLRHKICTETNLAFSCSPWEHFYCLPWEHQKCLSLIMVIFIDMRMPQLWNISTWSIIQL